MLRAGSTRNLCECKLFTLVERTCQLPLNTFYAACEQYSDLIGWLAFPVAPQ